MASKKVILLIESSTECGRSFLRGITKYSALHGHWFFYMEDPSYKEPSGNRSKSSWFRDVDADGIVVRDLENLDAITDKRLPIIVGSTVKPPDLGLPTILADSEKIGAMGAKHFIERGFREFAFCGLDEMQWSQNRCAGFCRELTRSGFEAQVYRQPKSKVRRAWEKEQHLIADWLKSLAKPVGIMACNDYRGRQLIETCKAVDIRVPEETAILGADNDDLVCNLSLPPLSSIHVNYEHAGYEAAELLDKLMAGEKMNNQKIIALPTRIVTRQSTDILAIEDLEVANVIRFIREHCNEPIQVSDVVKSTTLSQRGLYDRFAKVIGRPIRAEITRIRCEEMGRLLLETNMTVSQVAIKMGYYDDRHLSRYFKDEMGLTPRAYRRQHGHNRSTSKESTQQSDGTMSPQ